VADPNTIRVLSLDGGGMRGIFEAKFMEQFVQLWGINPNEIWKYFDVICGTSVGGLQALGLKSIRYVGFFC
jgi:patatin-like phospholipase/acyl hydrolase